LEAAVRAELDSSWSTSCMSPTQTRTSSSGCVGSISYNILISTKKLFLFSHLAAAGVVTRRLKIEKAGNCHCPTQVLKFSVFLLNSRTIENLQLYFMWFKKTFRTKLGLPKIFFLDRDGAIVASHFRSTTPLAASPADEVIFTHCVFVCLMTNCEAKKYKLCIWICWFASFIIQKLWTARW